MGCGYVVFLVSFRWFFPCRDIRALTNTNWLDVRFEYDRQFVRTPCFALFHIFCSFCPFSREIASRDLSPPPSFFFFFAVPEKSPRSPHLKKARNDTCHFLFPFSSFSLPSDFLTFFTWSSGTLHLYYRHHFSNTIETDVDARREKNQSRHRLLRMAIHHTAQLPPNGTHHPHHPLPP